VARFKLFLTCSERVRNAINLRDPDYRIQSGFLMGILFQTLLSFVE
jgi:hypothetical protein